MDKKTLYIALSLLALGVFLILLVGPEKVLKIFEGGGEKSEKSSLTEEEVKEIKYEATRTGDASLCEQLQDKDKDYCKYSVLNAEAGRKQDQTICDGIEDERRRIVCKDNVIITKSLNERDPAQCENMIDRERVDYCKEQVDAYVK